MVSRAPGGAVIGALLLLPTALLAAPAFAAPAADPPAAARPAEERRAGPEQILSVAWHASQYPLLYEGIPIHHALGVGYSHRLPAGLEGGVAARLVFPAAAEPSWALEGALHLDAVGTIGWWRPAAGLEVGASSRSTSEVLETARPPGSYFADLGTPEPLWLDFTATPVRVRVAGWEASLLRVGVGISLLHPGRAGRWSADLLTLARVF